MNERVNERVNERMNGRDGVTVVVMHLPGKGELNPLANAECWVYGYILTGK